MRRLILLALVTLFAADLQAENRLPAYVIELPESVADVFIADAAEATIYHFENAAVGVTLGDQGYVSIGQNGAGKERAWDRKTPLGIYFVVDQLDTSRLHEKYGVTAFPLDYPNVWDRRNERTGDGIWVHGVLAGAERRPPFDTDGCLALPNADLLALEDRFVPLVTPVIVTREIRWQDRADRDRLRDGLRAAVASWAASIAAADVHAYLSMYADDFSYRGMKLGEWASFRAQTLSGRGEVQVFVDELMLFADPEEEGLFLSRFRHRITDGAASSVTTKRLYWRRDASGEFRIVAEDNG